MLQFWFLLGSPCTQMYLMSPSLVRLWVCALKPCLLCFRTVPSTEIQLHRHGRGHHGRRSSSLPHHRLHHRDPDRPQGPAPSLHGQSVSLLAPNLNGSLSDGLSGAFYSCGAAASGRGWGAADKCSPGRKAGLCQPAPVQH